MSRRRRYTIGVSERMWQVIGAEEVTAVRALLIRDLDEHLRITAQIKKANGLMGYNRLILAAFCKAIHRRFGTRYTLTDIVEYVAEVRTRFRNPDRGIDPNIAERLIRKALGEGTLQGIDKKAFIYTAGVLLFVLVMDEELDGIALDTFLAEARATADSCTT